MVALNVVLKGFTEIFWLIAFMPPVIQTTLRDDIVCRLVLVFDAALISEIISRLIV